MITPVTIQTTSAEQWRFVFSSDRINYEVSDKGNVRRYRKRFPGIYRAVRPRALPSGYLRVSLGAAAEEYVHRLVLLAFVGQPPLGQEQAAHWNGMRQDNGLENLRWATESENESDKIRHGTRPHGEKNGQAKLTSQQVAEIRRLKDAGASSEILALQFHVSPGLINLIKRRKRWAHLSDS